MWAMSTRFPAGDGQAAGFQDRDALGVFLARRRVRAGCLRGLRVSYVHIGDATNE